MGLPLSGKTTLGTELGKRLGVHHLDIDGGPAHCVPPQEPDPYRSPEAEAKERKRMQAAYRVLHQALGINLQMGWSHR